ncbi:uncharacterized protein MELLADRAFT_68188 [Melampsora larici-populina 98AG31]|uniref:Uncharacterized protein n=1 Tax=Melampsora larici-populina (strain 98AG31 / pathotype 3-4-7) TaxID=747676 RepID=F4S5W3_MELLP|nr:uncharacterized protein MELLADRAFT_68188 [Melampsora larici-populina 98AG31]EGF99995.1 hypothetical protein MELLADRAFT_68188 [Melampsora larici-populina 98AG31]
MSSQPNKFACPLQNRVRKNGPALSASAKYLAELKAAEDEFCAEECQALAEGIGEADVPMELEVAEPEDEGVPYEYDIIIPDNREPFEDRLPSPEGVDNPDDNEELDAENQQTYAAQRVDEQERWLAVISPMFIAYMRLSGILIFATINFIPLSDICLDV